MSEAAARVPVAEIKALINRLGSLMESLTLEESLGMAETKATLLRWLSDESASTEVEDLPHTRGNDGNTSSNITRQRNHRPAQAEPSAAPDLDLAPVTSAVLQLRKIIAFWDRLDCIEESDEAAVKATAEMDRLMNEGRLILERLDIVAGKPR